MPAVCFQVRWPDGQQSPAYSPSTAIHDFLSNGTAYPLQDFLHRIDLGLHAAAERVNQVKGFYCSAAMDTLAELNRAAARYQQGQVTVLELPERR